MKLGATAFGGPAAHIAMMQDEAVARRRWVSEEEFLNLVAVSSLIPGPNSTEMAMLLGHRRAGRLGLLTAGAAFILPAALMVLGLAVAYRVWGALPAGQWLLYGARPVVLLVIVSALWKLGRSMRPSILNMALAAGALGLTLTFSLPALTVLTSGTIGMLWHNRNCIRRRLQDMAGTILPLGLSGAADTPAGLCDHPERVPTLFLIFLKVGAVLFGSGYVLIAYLEEGLVRELGWLTGEQLLDAVAVGQMTPGPVLTTSTFIGYQVSGLAGAMAATAAIFLPSFLIVLAIVGILSRWQASPWVSGFLKGANAGVLGLLAGVLLTMTPAALTDAGSWALLALGGVALFSARLSPLWVVPGAAILGCLYKLLENLL